MGGRCTCARDSVMRRILGLVLAGLLLAGGAVAAPLEHKAVVFFGSWSADIDDSAQAAIADAASWSKDHPKAVIRVEGYASTVGSKKANILLADLRAQVVVDALEAAGVAPRLIRQSGHGPHPYVDTPLEARRVEIVLRAP